jgi:hypothetical protein
MSPKVFQIGLNKTGTRSIFILFKRSGYKSVHWGKGLLAEDIAANSKTGETPLTDWDDTVLFTDIESVHTKADPIEGYSYFEFLDQTYPDAKFILNTRDVDRWLCSRMLHREGKYFRYFVHHYGTHDPIEIMQRWKKSWQDHHDAVRAYFADKPGKLVEFELGVDDGEKLKDFFAPEIDLDLSHWRNETMRLRKKQGKKA